MEKYKQIQTEGNYLKLLKSGMFFEFYPELTGNWEEDKKIILDNIIKINKKTPLEISVYSPNGYFIGVANEYEFLDILGQIEKAQIPGCYIKFFENKILIDKDGFLDDYPFELLDILKYHMKLVLNEIKYNNNESI